MLDSSALENTQQRIAELERAIADISREMRGPMSDAERMLLYYDRKELRQKLEHLKGEEVSR